MGSMSQRIRSRQSLCFNSEAIGVQLSVLSIMSRCLVGLRADKPEGSRFHLVGIQPTIAASRTIAGVLADRDEVLERALVHVRAARDAVTP